MELSMDQMANKLETILPIINDVDVVRQHTDRLGRQTGFGKSLAVQLQNTLKREDAEHVETVVVASAVRAVYAVDDTLLDPFQKVIAAEVIGHTWRPSAVDIKSMIPAGWEVFERVRGDAARNQGTVATIGDHVIQLFKSQGVDDLTLHPDAWESGYTSIRRKMPGVEVNVTDEEDDNFPDTTVTEVTYDDPLFNGLSHIDRPWRHLEMYDPASDRYAQPFVRLGEPDNPAELLNEHLTTDSMRFAARLLVATAGGYDWITVTPPGDGVKNKVVVATADAYVRLLAGLPSQETRMVSRSLPSDHRDHRDQNETVPFRKFPLANMDTEQRNAVLFAAGASLPDVETVTIDTINRLQKSAKPDQLVAGLRAAQVVDSFFDRLKSN